MEWSPHSKPGCWSLERPACKFGFGWLVGTWVSWGFPPSLQTSKSGSLSLKFYPTKRFMFNMCYLSGHLSVRAAPTQALGTESLMNSLAGNIWQAFTRHIAGGIKQILCAWKWLPSLELTHVPFPLVIALSPFAEVKISHEWDYMMSRFCEFRSLEVVLRTLDINSQRPRLFPYSRMLLPVFMLSPPFWK